MEDIPVRLSVVDALSKLRNDEAVIFLETIVEKDSHWDVCEVAAKRVVKFLVAKACKDAILG